MRLLSILLASAALVGLSAPALAQSDVESVDGTGASWADDISIAFAALDVLDGSHDAGVLAYGADWRASGTVGANRAALAAMLAPSELTMASWSGSEISEPALGPAQPLSALTDLTNDVFDVQQAVTINPLDEGAPAETTGPAIEPLAQTSFVIFFDYDSADLSAEAYDVLDDVVSAVDETGGASLLLDGYSDPSGSADYALDLSERRARAAADGLIARGLAPEDIVIRAFGQERLITPTADNAAEPQDHRVEIILS